MRTAAFQANRDFAVLFNYDPFRSGEIVIDDFQDHRGNKEPKVGILRSLLARTARSWRGGISARGVWRIAVARRRVALLSQWR